MAGIFEVQGFGALSEYNGQFSTASAAQSFQTMASLGSNSVALTVRIWTDNKTASAVIAHPAKTESDASVLAGFQAAHAAGLSVLFKPGITGLDSTISSSLMPSDVDAFFASYQAEIVHLAGIAEQGGVATFAIGNEMSKLTGAQYLPEWTSLIAAVRDVYHGDLTYAAATDEASHVSFWSQLDTIGVNTYPPLTSSTTPTVADMVHAWTEVPFNTYYANAFNYLSPVDFLHALSERYDKPVLMTEVGYRSIDGAAINPGSANSTVIDTAEQADAYNAFFQVWSAQGGSWMQGAELWQWDLSNKPNPAGYSVMGKPAETIVSQYFHGTGAVPNLAISGSSMADTIDVGRGNDAIAGGPGNDVIRGGAGNDTISGGPDVGTKLATTTLTITGYGSVVAGVGATAQILVNGKVVSGQLEFKPATDPAKYQTHTVTFDNPEQIDSVAIELTNSTSGRALHIKDFEINGVAMTPAMATNASSPGSFDLYVRSINFDTTAHQDWFVGAATDNDVISGGAGNDTIDGGGGIDTAVFSGDAGAYWISFNDAGLKVTNGTSGRDGSDQISNIEFLKFADATVDTSTIAPGSRTARPGDSYQIQAVDGAGGVKGETVRHTDGTRDVYNDAITGKAYVSEHIGIDATGHTVLVERFFGDGDLAFSQVKSSDGSVNASEYDSDGHLIKFATSHADGSFDQFTFDAAGYETGEITRYADGSRDIHTYGISGKDYTSEHVVRDAAGHSSLIEQFHGNGTLALQQTVDADGVRTLDRYDSGGQVTQQMVTQTDGSFVQSDYALDGALAVETTRHADGSRDVSTLGIEGKTYVARHDGFDAAGHRLSTVFDNTDGSHTMTAYASGVTLTSGVTSDIMNSAGGGTFVFREASGHDVINNFVAGEGAQHDVLHIASTIAADLAELSIHIVGSDTLIDLGHDASITLTGVITPLTSHDVLIV